MEWAAGLFEGEGCICSTRGMKGKLFPRLSLSSTDRDVIEEFHQAVGGRGKVRTKKHIKPQQKHWKTQYAWSSSRKYEVKEILLKLYPFLCKRRKAKAKEIWPLLEYKYSSQRRRTHGSKASRRLYRR